MSSSLAPAIRQLAGGLIVSCQANGDHPMHDSATIAKVAAAALAGGAVGLRINGPEDVAAVRAITDAPIIALYKRQGPLRQEITVDLDDAKALADAGADIIAAEITEEASTNRVEHVQALIEATGLPLMADISTVNEAQLAWQGGAQLVGTTLSGYTPQSRQDLDGPDVDLVRTLTDSGMRVIAEGRMRSPADVNAAHLAGAYAVVAGRFVTDPQVITEWMLAGLATAKATP